MATWKDAIEELRADLVEAGWHPEGGPATIGDPELLFRKMDESTELLNRWRAAGKPDFDQEMGQ